MTTGKTNLSVFPETVEFYADAAALAELTGATLLYPNDDIPRDSPLLRITSDGTVLEMAGRSMRGDLTNMLPRLRRDNLTRELLVRAAKIKSADRSVTVIDATAGLGEDSLMLAAAGYNVIMCERNPIIALMLKDALRRAAMHEQLKEAVGRMTLVEGDSISLLKNTEIRPDVVYLDPMFPEKDKSALTKKKFQLLHCLEQPCTDEHELLCAAKSAMPHKIVIKRPAKGPYLCGEKPSFSLQGKAVRYDCIVLVQP